MKKRTSVICFILAGFFMHPSLHAVSLNGLMTIDAGDSSGGSVFTMGTTSVYLVPGTAGGILLGEYQNFVLDPDEPHPENWDGNGALAGTGYGSTPVQEGTILQPFGFFGIATYVGTNPVSYQSGNAHPAPTADVDISNCVGDVCALTVDLSAWEVMWNGSAFEQGPRPLNTGPFVFAEGSFNVVTNEYVLEWDSQILGGPFSGVTASWRLEGKVVPVPAAVWLFSSGLLGLIGMARRRKAA
jgi:hypothetical protein